MPATDRNDKQFSNTCQCQVTKQVFARHTKTKKHINNQKKKNGEPEVPKKKKEKQKSDRKGRQFALTFNKLRKYQFCKYMRKNPDWITSYTFSNEFGSAWFETGHSHAFIKTNKKMSFGEFKKAWKDTFHFPVSDIRSCRNKSWLRYITKEDYRAVSCGVDTDLLSTILKTYLYALKRKGKSLQPTSYPYCNLFACYKRDFERFYEQFRRELEEEKNIRKFEGCELKRWQQFLELMLNLQNNREVMCVYEEKGNVGKSWMSHYLLANNNAIILENGSTKDLAYAYGNQDMVIFDFARFQQDRINYHILELLKDGRLFSSKYQSEVKYFKPKILCFANFPPEFEKLSLDRWDVYHLEWRDSPDPLLRGYRMNNVSPSEE